MREHVQDLLDRADQIGEEVKACVEDVQIFIAETELVLFKATVH
jgi:hypothetical protein